MANPVFDIRRKAPHLAILAFATVLVVSGAVLSLGAAGGALKTGAIPAVLIALVFSAAAIVPIAARIRHAPLIAGALVGAAWVTGSIAVAVSRWLTSDFAGDVGAGPYEPRSPMSDLIWIMVAGVVLVWIRTDVYVRPWEPEHVRGWALEGLKGMVREGCEARAVAGIVSTSLGFAVLFVPLAFRAHLNVGLIWVLRVLLMGGVITLASCIVLRDVEAPE